MFFKADKVDNDLLIKSMNYAVLTGNPKQLIDNLKKEPLLFFMKCPQIKDSADQVFFDVSPADLISFLCDDDMQRQVNNFAQQLPEELCTIFFKEWQVHQLAQGKGGADLVFIRGQDEPSYEGTCKVIRNKDIEWIDIYKSEYSMDEYDEFMEPKILPGVGGVVQSVRADFWPVIIRRPLLQNPNGIVCWQSSDNQLHWYYVNHDTQSMERIDIPEELLATHNAHYNALVANMTRMESHTARRSSNKEHGLINSIMRRPHSLEPIELVRQGIYYQQDGIDYIDTHYDFNRWFNAYLKIVRLLTKKVECERVWVTEVGHVQREVMWLIQRYSQKDFNFRWIDDDYKNEFPRHNLKILNRRAGWFVLAELFNPNTRKFHSDFGEYAPDSNFGFALRRGDDSTCAHATANSHYYRRDLIIDFVAALRFILDAKDAIDNFKPEISPSVSSNVPYSLGKS